MNRKQESTEVDVAIVGAGIAGAYVAWRLANTPPRKLRLSSPASRPHPRLRLFEQGELGGRLLSERLPGLPFNAELGAMRYTDRQLFVANLVRRLGLPTREFKFETALLYLRGALCDTTDPLPYKRGRTPLHMDAESAVRSAILEALLDLEFDDVNHNAAALKEIEKIIHGSARNARLLPTISLLSAQQWELLKRSANLYGRPLYDIGFWNLLHYYLGSEGFILAHDVLGYESILGNWNAAEAIPWFLRDIDANYMTVRTGMDGITTALAAELDHFCPNSLATSTKVMSIDRAADGKFILELRRSEENGSSSMQTCKASCVVLAVPRKALEEMHFSFRTDELGKLKREGKEDWFLKALDSVEVHPLFKLFLGYQRAWWHDPRGIGRVSGKAITDLPIRQVYYFGHDMALSETKSGMVMASYSDEHYVDFWRALHRQSRREESFYGGDRQLLEDDEQKALSAYGATEAMVRKAHRQLLGLHPDMVAGRIPEPYVALEKEWVSGWHTWRPRVKPWNEMKLLKKPFPDLDLFICGEAYSCEQGWIEGALRSAELVLRELGVSGPEWVDSKEYDKNGFAGYDEYIGLWPSL